MSNAAIETLTLSPLAFHPTPTPIETLIPANRIQPKWKRKREHKEEGNYNGLRYFLPIFLLKPKKSFPSSFLSFFSTIKQEKVIHFLHNFPCKIFLFSSLLFFTTCSKQTLNIWVSPKHVLPFRYRTWIDIWCWILARVSHCQRIKSQVGRYQSSAEKASAFSLWQRR